LTAQPFEVTLKHELFLSENMSSHLASRSQAELVQCGPTTSFQRQNSSLSKPKSKNQLQKSAGRMLISHYAHKNPDLT
jgi:hypothetical protein